MRLRLLDSKNEHDYIWTDSAYLGECFERLLSLGGLESQFHEKDARSHPPSEAAKKLNRFKSAIRACVEHVNGQQADKKDSASENREPRHGGGSRISLSTSYDIFSAAPA